VTRRNPEQQHAHFEQMRQRWAAKVAALIDPLIPSGDDDRPITRQALADALNLSTRTIDLGVAYLRDHPRTGQKPLLSGSRGYIRSLDASRTTEYHTTLKKYGLTLLRRSRKVLQPYLATLPADRARSIEKAHARLIEDMVDAPSLAWTDAVMKR
jgi:hypothetical protein